MFSRKEISFFNDPYFRVIRQEEQFVEVQSLNTKHCWNIFKNQFETKYKITLYHKHKSTDAYYHKHYQCHTVVQAIEQIKSHDDYVLEQAELKRQQEQQVYIKKDRHLKVHETSGYKYKPTPAIILKGDWLRDWGFEMGSEVNIVCEGDGKLTITAEK